MGKLIRLRVAANPRRQRHAAQAFHAFGEMQSVERAQFKFFGICVATAALLMAVLQLATA